MYLHPIIYNQSIYDHGDGDRDYDDHGYHDHDVGDHDDGVSAFRDDWWSKMFRMIRKSLTLIWMLSQWDGSDWLILKYHVISSNIFLLLCYQYQNIIF